MTMEKTNGKTRHGFVTFWLWVSIAGNLIGAYKALDYLGHFGTWRSWLDPTVSRIALLLSIVVIIGQILLINWRILGFFINCAASLFFLLFAIFYLRLHPVFSVILALAHSSIIFGILQIKKYGVSAWNYLIQEAGKDKRVTIISHIVVFGSILFFLLFATFQITRLPGKTVALFSPQRIIGHWDGYKSRLLGSHVLKTEFGEIQLDHLSNIVIFGRNFYVWEANFHSGKASHNLVFEGTELPKTLSIRFSPTQIEFLHLRNFEISTPDGTVRVSSITVNLKSKVVELEQVSFVE
jgi:hypothetical protein